MIRNFENCGRASLRKGGGAYCNKKKTEIISYHGPIMKCPCSSWVHRLRIDRLRRKGKR